MKLIKSVLIITLILIMNSSCRKNKNVYVPYSQNNSNEISKDQEEEPKNWEELSYRIIAEEGYPIETSEVEDFNTIAIELFNQNKYQEAKIIYNYTLIKDPENGIAHYNLACLLTLLQKDNEKIITENIFNHLIKSIEINRIYLTKALYEPSLESLQESPEWAKIEELVENSYYLPIVNTGDLSFIDLQGNTANLPFDIDKCLIGNINYTETYINRYYPVYKIIKNGKEGLINCRGREVAPPIYDSINSMNNWFKYELTFMGKKGIIDNLGNKIFECKYNKLFQIAEDLYYFRNDQGNGLIDSEENITNAGFMFYDRISKFSDDLLLVYTYDKYGLINYNGYNIISFDANYTNLELVGNNIIATIETFNGEKKRLLSLSGEILIDAIYDDIKILSSETLAVKLNEKWGIVSKEGYVLHSFIYDSIEYLSYFLIELHTEDTIKIINLRGNTIVEECTIPNFYSEGYAILGLEEEFKYVDYYGNLLNTPTLTSCYPFNESLAAVNYEGLFGFIDKTGAWSIEPEYENSFGFSEQLAAVKKNGLYGYINIDNNIEIDYQYEEASNFRNGVAAISSEGKWGLIDKESHLIMPYIWDNIDLSTSAGNLIAVKKDNLWGYTDKKGVVLIVPQYDTLPEIPDSEKRILNLGDKFGVIDSKGDLTIPVIYDSITDIGEDTYIVNRNNLYGVIDIKGEIILKVENDIVLEPILGIYPFVKNNRLGYADPEGTIIYYSSDHGSHEGMILDTFTGRQ